MDIFMSADVTNVLLNKFVVIIGDSNQRTVYKDLILLLQENRYLTQKELRNKGELSVLADELIEGGRKGVMTNGICYKEVRQYCTDTHLVRFYFVTRCYNNYMESILTDLKEEPRPDVVIMNSCLWDMTRYGNGAIFTYKQNLIRLFDRFAENLPTDCLLIWNTTLPISSSARGGFLVPEIEFMTTTLRLDILEANYYAQQVAVDHGFDVLDLHFYLRHTLDRRVPDGIHWDMVAHRQISNLILDHICKAWRVALPRKRPVTFGSFGSRVARQTHAYHQPPRVREQFSNDHWNQQGNFRFGSGDQAHNMRELFNNSNSSFQWMPYENSAVYNGIAASEKRHRYQAYRRY